MNLINLLNLSIDPSDHTTTLARRHPRQDSLGANQVELIHETKIGRTTENFMQHNLHLDRGSIELKIPKL